MIAEPVGDRPLHRHHVPSRIVGRIGVGEHVLGLCELAGVGERLAIFAEHVKILRGLDGRRLDDRDRLAVSGKRAQRPGVFDRGGFFAGIALVALPALIGVGLQPRLVGRHGARSGNGAGDVAEVVAAGKRRGDRRDPSDESDTRREGGAGGQSQHRSPGDGQKRSERPTRTLLQAARLRRGLFLLSSYPSDLSHLGRATAW